MTANSLHKKIKKSDEKNSVHKETQTIKKREKQSRIRS
jgi:hypothetical protein